MFVGGTIPTTAAAAVVVVVVVVIVIPHKKLCNFGTHIVNVYIPHNIVNQIRKPIERRVKQMIIIVDEMPASIISSISETCTTVQWPRVVRLVKLMLHGLIIKLIPLGEIRVNKCEFFNGNI